MTSTSEPATWPVFIGTARGSTHESRHLPNQDNAGWQPVIDAGGVVVAVADGHGAARHFRSSTGSMLAVKATLAVVGELAGATAGPWPAETADALSSQLPRAIVARWRELVARHLASHPYSPDEAAGLELAHDGPEIPYGSTLLVGLVVPGWLICAQIGDGDMLAVQPDGGAWIPVGGDDRLDGFRTTSLCQDGAVASFRTAVHDLRTEPLLALQLSTDGYGNSQVTDPWQPAVAADLAGLAAEHDHDWFRQQIPLWAQRCASAQGSGDDTTIALLLAPDSARLAAARQAPAQTRAVPPATAFGSEVTAAGPAAGLPVAGTPESAGPGPIGPVRPRPSRRRAALAAIGVVVVAAGIAIGLLAASSSGSAPAAPATGQPAPKASPTVSGQGPVQPRSSATVPASPSTASPGRTSSGAHHVTSGGQSDVTKEG
jgi:hypothetical protein